MKLLPALFAIFSGAILFSCNKKDSDTSTKNAVQYTVNGLADVQVKQYRDTTFLLPVGLYYESGTQENVTLTVVSMPENCTITPNTVNGIPTFAAILSIHILSLTTGNLPVSVKCTSASGEAKTFTFNLVSSANAYCRDIYLDTFALIDSMYDITAGSLYSTNSSTVIVSQIAADPTKLFVGGDTIKLDCGNSLITKDSILRPNGTYYGLGTGTRGNNRIDYQYNYHSFDYPHVFRISKHLTRL